MQLSVRDLTRLFNVTEQTVYQWIDEKGLPAHQVDGRQRFDKSELIAWAAANRVETAGDFFDRPAEPDDEVVRLADALEAGGFRDRVPGATKEEVLAAVVGAMALPAEVDRPTLLRLLLAREQLASTGLGDGIAVPHVREPLALPVGRPLVHLCFLERPVDFQAVDGKPVHVLFSLVSPTVRTHLLLLSRLSFALHDADFKRAVTGRASRDVILREARRVDASLLPAGAAGGEAAGEGA